MTRGERVIRFIESYLIVPEGDLIGQPVVLLPFQTKFILDVYDNPAVTDTAILSIARKNAKTATIAFLVLAHTVGPEAVQNSRIISGAMSRDQAGEVYTIASKCVMVSPKVRDLIRIIPSSKKLVGLPMNVEYQAISAEGKTAHGKSPIVAILDEVGQIRGPRSAFVDAITTSQGAYSNPLLIYISTQASDDADLFSVVIDDARISKRPKTVCHVHAADPDAKCLDEEQWKKANPAMGVFRSYEDMRKQAEKANSMPSFENTFRNLNLNQRVSVHSPFVSKAVWEACGGSLAIPHDGVLFGGLDLSMRFDLTCLILLCETEEGIAVECYFWAPAEGLRERCERDKQPYDVWAKQGFLRLCPGHIVDFDYVAKEVAEIIGDRYVQAIAYDRWRIDILKQDMNRLGLDFSLVPCGQGYKDMTPAVDILEGELLNGKLRHGMNPILKMCAANASVERDAAGGRKFDKSKATGRIDGMVALAMALKAMRDGEDDQYYSGSMDVMLV